MTDNFLLYAVMCESWMYFPKKNVCGFLVQFCVQLQCSPDVNLLLDGIPNHATLITSNLILTYEFSLFNPFKFH